MTSAPRSGAGGDGERGRREGGKEGGEPGRNESSGRREGGKGEQ